MATSSLTLYKDNTTSEAFNLATVVGRVTTYEGASSTPTLPVQLDLTLDKKQVGNMSNDRFYINCHRSGAATARGAIATSGGTLSITVAKDPSSGSSLLSDAVAAVCELISYVTGAAPTSAAVSNITKLCAGQWL